MSWEGDSHVEEDFAIPMETPLIWTMQSAPQMLAPMHSVPRIEVDVVLPREIGQILANLGNPEGPPKLQELLQHSFAQVKLRLENLDKMGEANSHAIGQVHGLVQEHERLLKTEISNFLRDVGDRLSKLGGLENWANGVKTSLDSQSVGLAECKAQVLALKDDMTQIVSLLGDRVTKMEVKTEHHVTVENTLAHGLEEMRTISNQKADWGLVQNLRAEIEQLRACKEKGDPVSPACKQEINALRSELSDLKRIVQSTGQHSGSWDEAFQSEFSGFKNIGAGYFATIWGS